MNMNEKLEKIKKSCKVGKTVSRIMFIIVLVGLLITIVGSIVIASKKSEFEQAMIEANDEGYVSADFSLGVAKLVNVDLGDPKELESSIPAIEDEIKEHPYAITVLANLTVVAVLCLVFAVVLKLIESVFALIEKEENPFTDAVIKRVMTVMIVVSALLLFGTGTAFGILGFIITWVVYTVMDYGRILQIQSDETL